MFHKGTAIVLLVLRYKIVPKSHEMLKLARQHGDAIEEGNTIYFLSVPFRCFRNAVKHCVGDF